MFHKCNIAVLSMFIVHGIGWIVQIENIFPGSLSRDFCSFLMDQNFNIDSGCLLKVVMVGFPALGKE